MHKFLISSSLLDFFIELLVLLFELVKLRILQARLDMKSEWQVGEHILIESFVVILHVQVESLLIVNVEIVFNFIIQLALLQCRYYFRRGNCHRLVILWLLYLFVRSTLWSNIDIAQSLLILDNAILEARFLVRVLARDSIHQPLIFDLGPAEVALFHFLSVVLHPPESVFQKVSNHYRVVAFADEILVHDICRGELKGKF